MWLTIADRIQGLSWLGHSQDLRAEGQRNSCHAQDVLEREPHNMIKSTPQGLYPSSNRQKVSDITVQDHRWTGEIISRQETLQGNGINSYRPESNPMLYTPSPGPPSPQPYSPSSVQYVHDKLPWMSWNDATHANSWRRLGSGVRVTRWSFRDSTVLETMTFAAMNFRWTFLKIWSAGRIKSRKYTPNSADVFRKATCSFDRWFETNFS